MLHKKAASVLPEPVGARMSACSPAAIAGHPSACAGVGSPNVVRNHSRTGGEKLSSTTGPPYRAPLTVSRRVRGAPSPWDKDGFPNASRSLDCTHELPHFQ